jgi:hypothetical protein
VSAPRDRFDTVAQARSQLCRALGGADALLLLRRGLRRLRRQAEDARQAGPSVPAPPRPALLTRPQIVTERITVSSSTAASAAAAKTGGASTSYALSARVMRTASGGKTLLARGASEQDAPYADFFDAQGTMDVERFEAWVATLVDKASA